MHGVNLWNQKSPSYDELFYFKCCCEAIPYLGKFIRASAGCDRSQIRSLAVR